MVNGHNGQDGRSVVTNVDVAMLLERELVVALHQNMAEEIVAQT